MKTKTCRVCGKELNIKMFSKNRLSKDGHVHSCNLCKKEIIDKRHNMVQPYGMKWCSDCNKVLPLFFFAKTKKICKFCQGTSEVRLYKNYERFLRSGLENKSNHVMIRPASFKVWGSRMLPSDEPEADIFGNLVVSCKLCGQRFIPTRSQVIGRASAVEKGNGFCNLYCSQACKDACPLYKLRTARYVNAFKSGISNEEYEKTFTGKRDAGIQKTLRDMALKVADYKCEICGETENLQAHHIKPVKIAPMLAEDVENIVILCRDCHTKSHSLQGCTLHELRECVV